VVAQTTPAALLNHCGGGYSNFATNSTATVSGGRYNTAGGLDSIILAALPMPRWAEIVLPPATAKLSMKVASSGDLQEADFASTVADQ